jgi:peptide/nickel transport system permease protein
VRAATFLLRRAGGAVLLLLGATLLLFVFAKASPTDPLIARFGISIAGLSPQDAARLRHQLGLDDPVWQQYLQFLRDTVTGDFGRSARSGQPVFDLLRGALPVTVELAGLAALLSGVAAVGLGTIAAFRRGRATDRAIMLFSTVCLAAPSFWLGVLAIDVFAIRLAWVPSGGFVPLSQGIGPWLQSLVLPAITLAAAVAGLLTRVVRSAVIEELGKDYVRTGLAAGVSRRTVLWRNVVPNALNTPLTVFGLYVGYLLGGAVLVEVVFSLPGMGQLMVNAATTGDSTVVRAVALVTIALFLAVNIAVDALAVTLDPRRRS